MNNIVDMIIEPVRDGIILPQYNDPEDACMDVFANFEDPKSVITINPGETKLIPLGFKLGIPQGWQVDIRPRSGISLKTLLRIANTPGTIDTNFKDEVKVLMWNASDYLISIFEATNMKCMDFTFIKPETVQSCKFMRDISGKCIGCNYGGCEHASSGVYVIRHGDKIAQMQPTTKYKFNFTVGKATDIGTDRGGGFGSSGVRRV